MSKFDEAAPDRTGKKVGEVLKFRDSGPSVEEARKAMLAAGQAPSGMVARPPAAVPVAAEPVAAAPIVPAVIPHEVADVIESDFEEEIEPPKPVVAVPAPAAPAPLVTPRVERVENSQFVGEIKQDNGKWVAEIRYKNGAGTERFSADSRGQLMMKLLEGKGNATLRVNKAVRREKLGWSELDRQYPLPDGISTEDFDKMTDKAQDALLLSIAREQVFIFREAHPDFYRTDGNAQKLNSFLNKEKLPITARNLEYALDELSDENLPPEVRLEKKPEPGYAPVTPSLEQLAPVIAPARTDSAPVVVAATAPVSTAAVAVAAPAVKVRPRGTTGLRPGDSSSETELGRPPEGGSGPRQLSEEEARKMPMKELARIVKAERGQNRIQR
ncbi:MAG: hypothetical protein ACYDHE_11230 [Candidatus Acidiferrales bacterium]